MEMEDESVEGGGGVYYVQSPSTISHANSCSVVDLHHPSNNNNLSRSSSRGSNNNNNIISINIAAPTRFDNAAAAAAAGGDDEIKRLINSNSSSSITNDGWTHYYGGGWCKYLYFSYSPNSTSWILLQVSWRFLLSLGIALLVFYMATKPQKPNISIKVSKVREYEIGEGVDGTGVSTKILNCNISLHLFIHNPSNLFPLHIQPPLLQLSFATLSLASTPIHSVRLYLLLYFGGARGERVSSAACCTIIEGALDRTQAFWARPKKLKATLLGRPCRRRITYYQIK